MASAGGGSSLKFVVEIAADQATQGLQALQLAVNQASGAIKTSFAGIGPAARGAGHEVEGLRGKIAEFARGERGERRIASFFVRDIAEIIPISKEAKFALTDLGGAMLGGGALGMGLAAGATAIGLISEAFRESGKEAEESLKKTKEWAKGFAAELERSLERVRLARAEIAGGTAGRTREQAVIEREKAASAHAEATEEVQKAEAALEHAQLSAFRGLSGRPIGYEDFVKRIEVAREAQKTTAANFIAVMESTSIDIAKATNEAGERQSREIDAAAEKEKTAWERARAQREREVRDQFLNAERGFAELEAPAFVTFDTSNIAEDAKKAAREAAKAAEQAAKEERDRYLHADQGFAELEAPAFGPPDFEKTEHERNKRLKREQEEYRDEIKKTATEYEHFGNIAAHTLTGVITGTMSGAQAMQYLFGALVQASLQYLAKLAAAEIAKDQVDRIRRTGQVMQEAQVAGAGGTAWAAPTMGPYAIAVGAGLMAAVLAEFAISGSAAKGARIPAGVNPVLQLHGGEHVIPANIARRYERGAPGAGGSEITINAIDAAGVEKLFRKNGRALVRALDRQARRARA